MIIIPHNLRLLWNRILTSLLYCTCGSGAHPRPCAKHPKAWQGHVWHMNIENNTDHCLEELEEIRNILIQIENNMRA